MRGARRRLAPIHAHLSAVDADDAEGVAVAEPGVATVAEMAGMNSFPLPSCAFVRGSP